MSAEQNPIVATEYVLRRVHKDHFDAHLPVPIMPVAFKPTESDVDGISVYHEQLISAAEVGRAGRTPGAYYVARLSVAALHALSLTVIPVPSDLPGHAVIPELNRALYAQDK